MCNKYSLLRNVNLMWRCVRRQSVNVIIFPQPSDERKVARKPFLADGMRSRTRSEVFASRRMTRCYFGAPSSGPHVRGRRSADTAPPAIHAPRRHRSARHRGSGSTPARIGRPIMPTEGPPHRMYGLAIINMHAAVSTPKRALWRPGSGSRIQNQRPRELKSAPVRSLGSGHRVDHASL